MQIQVVQQCSLTLNHMIFDIKTLNIKKDVLQTEFTQILGKLEKAKVISGKRRSLFVKIASRRQSFFTAEEEKGDEEEGATY